MNDAEITHLLSEVQGGSAEAQSQLASAVYDELHQMAARYMYGERSENSIQATILVHDAFMRLVGRNNRTWQNRAHFFAVAAQVMRRILVDSARRRLAEKRGGRQPRVHLDESVILANGRSQDWVAVDQALDRLAKRDERLARTVELRFFGGLTEEEIGEVLDVSPRTVKRDWRVAKAWLRGELLSIKSDDSNAMAAH